MKTPCLDAFVMPAPLPGVSWLCQPSPPGGVLLASYPCGPDITRWPDAGRAAARHPGSVASTRIPTEAGRAPARRRVPARTRLDFWFDGALLVAYTLVYSLGFTGLAIHEWLGLGIGLALLLHLTLHWDWVVRTTRKLFVRGGRDRGIWLLNLALLVVMTLCVLSGVLISRVALYQLGISVHAGPFWTTRTTPPPS